MADALRIVPRLSHDRGHADHGWLKTFHTFSVSEDHGSDHIRFGSLRIINEDRVALNNGFGLHTHREFEIFSYIVDGELEHRDSMGNVEIMKRGDVQMTSAGTGIRHSEHQHGAAPVHFLQIWAFPHTRGLTPSYYTRHFADAEKMNRWATVVAPVDSEGVVAKREAEGPAPVHSALKLAAAVLSPGTTLTHVLPANAGERKAYLHIIQRSGYNPGTATGASVKISGVGAEVTLSEGDGAYMFGAPVTEISVENIGGVTAEVLLFDVDL